ncbi:xanthine dehydrogenase family protein molybdopterin-binding subunit [Hymenobacter sp. H14-R3]|uniref:xanthine dehydrogenase family protein molybdopterin-binding subunit n=1 Tax=Hymenobacter sp. H14-R3 TaxID=3046308 RepID=UPI0024BA4A38|nr:xanthine dehydrogenase family protein molybdopterin-binding subunit [Hymenobacter sp. H14-R3]MDJ0364684.1 xanthine dehydrogenase family protein molybdopterin-binding subunit [Hymenobacter sp. H14-R3]
MSQTIATPPTIRLDSDVIGRPVSRTDGAAKVSGAAKYAAEYNVPNLWHGYIVSSPIAKGKITKIDAAAVLAIPGVQQVFSHENVPSLAWFDRSYKDDIAPGGSPFRPLHNADVLFSMQPVALVVAETFELARYAASVLRIEYAVDEDFNTDLEKARAAGKGFDAPKGKPGFLPPPKPKGDADKAFKAAPHQVEAAYTHHTQHHNPMEMFASTVEWLGDGKKLKIYDKTQGAGNTQQYISKIFGLSKEEAWVISKYTGGAFGSGLRPQYQSFLAVLAALELAHSVRVSMTRQQMFSMGHRAHTIQDLKLAADDQGYLQALEHHAFAETSQFENETETVVNWSGILYKCANTKFSYELAKVDVNTPADMRAPGAATGSFAIECAIDELAYKAGVDPLEFRRLNYTYRDPTEDKPFSSKRLLDCYQEGATRFGWDQRTPEPRSMREGNMLVGWGMATGCWDAAMQKTAAKASLTAAGHLTVSSATNDIGTGTYTIMTQVAAQTLGLPMADVTAVLGDTTLPPAPVQGGSWTAASTGSAVQAACQELGKKLLKLAQKMADSPLKGIAFEDVQFVDGHLRANEDIDRSVAIADVLATSGEATVEAESGAEPNPVNMLKYSMHSHNAVFVEVKVDEDLGTVHVTRVVNAVAAGRVLNPKTARSQVLGGTVWGISMALMEETFLDNNLGRYMNHNYAEYHVPVNADIHKIDVILVEEEDDHLNPLGVKGIGEIGMLGVAAAVANAVYHATGKRVRDLPLTIDKLL